MNNLGINDTVIAIDEQHGISALSEHVGFMTCSNSGLPKLSYVSCDESGNAHQIANLISQFTADNAYLKAVERDFDYLPDIDVINNGFDGDVIQLTSGQYVRIDPDPKYGTVLNWGQDPALSGYLTQIQRIVKLNRRYTSTGVGTGSNSGFRGNGVWCSKMTDANINGIISAGIYMFLQCTELTSITCDTLQTSYIGAMFESCTKLRYIKLPSITAFHNREFYDCSNLEVVDLSECKKMPTAMSFDPTDPAQISSNANIFYKANPNYKILVSPAMYPQFKTYSGWPSYADHIVSSLI